jgi:6-methylsalicylate decarboxylase
MNEMDPKSDLRTKSIKPTTDQTAFFDDSIDVHHHILPPEYLQALTDIGITRSIGVPFPKWSVDDDLELMDRLNVKIAVLSFSTPAANVAGTENARAVARLCNELVKKMVDDHPDRYGAFATLPPLTDVEGALKEIEYSLDILKIDGVELMSNYELKYLGDPSFEKVYEALNDRRAVVHVHPSDPPGVQLGIPAAVMDAPFDTTRAAFSLICSGVMERYSDIAFILSHGGGTLPYLSYRIGKMAPFVWESFRNNASKGFNEYLNRFYYDTAIVSPDALPYLIKQAGVSNVIVGTDYPFAGNMVPTECLKAVQTYADINADERSLILRKNASGLFPRLGEKRRGRFG